MSRIGITYHEVKEAIAELQGRQKNPTVDNIREVLGTGSKSTIARFLREWRAQHHLANDSDGRLPADLLAIVNGLWDTLRAKAEAEIDQYRQESDTQMAHLQQQLTESKQVEATLRHNLHTQEEQLHLKVEESHHLKATLLAEEQEKIRLIERVASLELRHQEHQVENQRLHQLLKHMQDNLEHYQAAIQQLREEQALLIEKQQMEYEQRLSQLLTQANVAISEKASLQILHDQLLKGHDSLTLEYKSQLTKLTETGSQLESLKIVYDTFQHEHELLKEQYQAQATQLLSQQHALMELRLNITSKDEKIFSLEEGLVKATDKIEILRHDTQFALQEKSNLEGQLKQMQAILSSRNMQAVG